LSLSVYDLAVEVVLYLVAFQRRVADGEELNYEDTRAEVLALLNDLDQRSHGEPGLWDNWTKARAPLVYLIDEVMILNCNWAHRDRWADECLEVALLGHPEALGGENFYTEADEALRELEAWREYKGHVFSKLPAYAQTRTKQLFPEAAEHTVVLDPNYEPVMRLLYVFIGFVLVISLYLGSTWVYWSQMVDELEEGARNAPVPTSQQVEEG
jgi:type VI protein secretion system component VasF